MDIKVLKITDPAVLQEAFKIRKEVFVVEQEVDESEEYEFEEIAKIVNMNETAIRVALSRARKKIRESMTNTHLYGTK